MSSRTDKKLGWRYVTLFAGVFLLMIAVLSVVMWRLYYYQVEHQKTIIQAKELHVVQLARQLIDKEVEILKKDALYLAEKSTLNAWLDTRSPSELEYLTEDIATFARHRGVYEQIRFLNDSGLEIVRVQKVGDLYQAISSDKLQDKSSRYYVEQSLSLDQGQIYISPLDLNVENQVVEYPPNPVLRVGTPVFDQKGRKRGLIVVNYKGELLLDRLRALRSPDESDIWLINSAGYWLLGPNEQKEWGFMYPERQDVRFDNDYKEAWNAISTGPKQHQMLLADGLFTYQRTYADNFSPGGNGPSWTLLAYVPQSKFSTYTEGYLKNATIAFLALALLLALVSGFVAFYVVRRREAEAKIRESEAHFRGLFDYAPDAIVIVDQQGVIVLVNSQAEKKFGYTSDELLGQGIEVLVPKRARKQHVNHRRGYISKPVLRPMGEGRDLFGLCKDGSEFPVEISLSPVNVSGEMSVLSNIRDITARKQAEQAIKALNINLKQQNHELELINNELEAFSYSVSHDLRAPLRAMDGFSSFLITEYADKIDDKGRDRLDRIRAASQRMGVLIDSLLSLSRVSRTELKRENVDLTQLALEVLDELSLGDPDRQVKFIVQPGLTVHGDLRLLRVMLDNLLGNAWKFTGKNNKALIEVDGFANASESVYRIKDNGVGFDMEFADKLFGAFQRLHSATEFSGTGIGLATVQRAAHKHGGRVWADSKVGEGSTFYFTIQPQVMI